MKYNLKCHKIKNHLKLKNQKIKDNEGLGSNIPIESLENLALTIGGAALTGGATAAGEAFVSGGLAGVMGAGEAILGASIGSGVATGASSVLGQSAVGNIASGIIGGVAGKSIGVKIGNRLRNRNATQPGETISQPTEQTPLLGNRLGGRRGRNRLVNDRIEIQPDVQSVNRLAPEIERPQPVPGKSTMEILKHIVKKKVKAVSDRVSNFGQQLTGRRKKGTFAALEFCTNNK